ncbi:anthranilate synthase component II [Legionella sp. CNM-4043-24]|uniref:anthranilate synthase component II n=1 Tax=Legionella sp. CNM-4043-24 TaxID=3421646 RepID=UPI00403ACADB
MILVIDNYDSFVYNLARYVRESGFREEVVRNDAISLSDIDALKPSHIILSPGPCTPDEAGITLDVIRCFASRIPILGVCLGHQAIGQAFGASLVRARNPTHGKASWINHDGAGIFQNLPAPLKAGRYHSLALSRDNFPSCLSITASAEDGDIMALRHRLFPVVGLQFHPESVLTEHGHQLIANFLGVQVQSQSAAPFSKV